MPIKLEPEHYITESGCWVCDTHKQIRIDGKKRSIVYHYYTSKYGPIPDETPIIPTCKTKGCVNPEHLTIEFGTSYARTAKEIQYKEQPNGCHNVISHKPDTNGYPTIKKNKKKIAIHRYVYMQHNGQISSDVVIRQKCDNPLCCNIEHLEAGTHADNVADRVSRGRSAIGEDNGRKQLTEDSVKYIRDNSEISNSELAKKFKVDPSTIRDVKSFKTWKHVK